MRFQNLVLAMCLSLPTTTIGAVAAHAQSAPCQFVLGFQTLNDLDAEDIGDCVDNQAFAANGDAQQHTTKGLMAWRKADNWTAFTNGFRTWINGPAGLVSRLNTRRFSWEANPEGLPLAGAGSAQGPPAAAPASSLTWSTMTFPPCDTDPAKNQATYTNGDVTLSGYLAKPQGAGPFPAVLMLHTRGGFTVRESFYAGQLAGQGFVALAPDYFSPEGLSAGDYLLPDARKTDLVREDLARGLDCIRSLPYVARDRVGVLGFSLGGYLGQLLAVRPEVKALAIQFSVVVLPQFSVVAGQGINRAPAKYPLPDFVGQIGAPILMLHGDADTEVPYASIQKAVAMLKRAGKQVDLVPYPGIGHAWDVKNSPAYIYDAATTADALARTLAFFGNTLH